MKKIKILDTEFELIKNYKSAFDKELVNEFLTEYFLDFDYVVGDLSYSKIRLKGFCDKDNKRFNKINDYNLLEKYLKENCAYDCSYFILKKMK